MIDFEKHRYWDEWNELKRPFPRGIDTLTCEQLSFTVDLPNALLWHWYSIPGTGGMWSQRAVDLLWPYAKKHLRRFTTTLNGAPYYILSLPRELGLNCLDHDHSDIEYFTCDPSGVKYIHRYAFHLERIDDPLIFFVPEKGDLMATDSIRRMVEQAGLKGFSFRDPAKMSAERARGE